MGAAHPVRAGELRPTGALRTARAANTYNAPHPRSSPRHSRRPGSRLGWSRARPGSAAGDPYAMTITLKTDVTADVPISLQRDDAPLTPSTPSPTRPAHA